MFFSTFQAIAKVDWLGHMFKKQIVGKSATKPGFTLVELLVAVSILSVLSAGLFSVINYVQRTNIKIINNVNLLGDVDYNSKLIRTKLGRAESIVIETANSVVDSCLKLKTRRITDLKGYNFSGNTMIADGDYLGVTGNAARSVSFWMWNNSTSAATKFLVKWGKHNLSNAHFGVIMNASNQILVDYSGNQMASPTSPVVNDGQWHHVLVSYGGAHNSTSSKLFIDGVEQTVTFINTNPLVTGVTPATNDYFRVGARDTSANDAYDGVIGDIRVWSAALGQAEATALTNGRQRPDAIAFGDLELHWPLRVLNSDNVTVDDSGGFNRDGALANIDADTILFGTTVETDQFSVFGMYDLDADGKYELHSSDNSDDCPSNPVGVAGWSKNSDDIYAPDGSGGGFFKAKNDEPASLLFTYSFEEEKELGGESSAGLAVASRKLSASRSFKKAELCRTDTNLRFGVEDTNPANCNISRAFALIETGYNASQDELYMQNADITVGSNSTVYRNIPFVPEAIIGTWRSTTGVLELSTTDNSTFDPSTWSTALQSVAYRPLGTNYTTNKRLLFALGYLPFKSGDDYHYYDFVSVDEGQTMDWRVGYTEARSDAMRFCGMRGYLATVTSVEENSFLTDRFLTSSGGLPRGWLGASDNMTEGTWTWRDGPEAGQQFWDGLAGGKPVKSDGTIPLTSEYVTSIVSMVGLDYRVERPVSSSVKLRYHRWSNGEPNDSWSADGLTLDEHYLQVCGLPAGNGVWNDLPPDRPCQTNNDGVDPYRVCGYYLEYGGRAGEVDPGLVLERSFDISKQREYCAIDGLIVPKTIKATSGVDLAIGGILLTSDDSSVTGSIIFSTTLSDSRLWVSPTSGVSVTGDNTSSVSLSGTVADLRLAIASLNYVSPDGYFGDDNLAVDSSVAGVLFNKKTPINVEPNCGGEANGTATRFDIGYYDNSTVPPTFTTNQYRTSVSEWDAAQPAFYYGFCDGSSRYTYPGELVDSGSCSSGYYSASTRLQGVHTRDDAISVFLYEESDRPTRDRFSLFFIFDQDGNDCSSNNTAYNNQLTSEDKLNWARTNGKGVSGTVAASYGHSTTSNSRRCHARFRLSNIEVGRNLDNTSDMYTFTDDPMEYTAVIGADGTLIANAAWNSAHDGVVVPLRLPADTMVSDDNTTELNTYANGDPILELLFWDSLQEWRIRTLNAAQDAVEYRNFTIDDDSGTKTPAIKLNVSKSERCPAP